MRSQGVLGGQNVIRWLDLRQAFCLMFLYLSSSSLTSEIGNDSALWKINMKIFSTSLT